MSFRFWAVGVVLAALLVFQFFQFNVLQDDAFISFRYVRNFLEGHGLVFNVGERVEGYTNFFWIMLLALLAKLGLPLIETARWAGVLAAIGTLGVSIYAARRWYPQRGWVWIISAPFLLAANGALAYWAGSGLETGLFTFLAAAGAVTYFSRPNLSLLLVALATLTRPEGALLAFLFGVIGILLKQRSWKATLTFWGGLALLLIPYAVFKWFYYGSLLPNPFYAKTGFSTEYLLRGLEYGWLFLRHYGGYGLFLILPFLFWKKLTPFSRFSLLVFAGYGLYVISVGGDALPAHRFFVPVLVFFYFPVVDSIFQVPRDRWYRNPVFAAAVFLAGLYHYQAPHAYLKTTGYLQKASVFKMSIAGRSFDKDKTVGTVAATAIGALSYYLGTRRIIDMLGLVDTMVARHPAKIAGLSSSWKELNYNAGYVLSQKPDIIYFSTGSKPSGFAERALFLYPDFRQNYRLEFLCSEGMFEMYYRRFQNLRVNPGPDQPAHFVNLINQSINSYSEKNYRKSVVLLKEAMASGPMDCSVLYSMLGAHFLSAGYLDSSEVYLKKGMELDHGGSVSRYYYSVLLYNQKRYSEMAVQDSFLLQAVPNAEEYLRMTRGFHP